MIEEIIVLAVAITLGLLLAPVILALIMVAGPIFLGFLALRDAIEAAETGDAP